MEYDSSESMRSVERADALSPRTAIDVRITAARRRRRRAAAAQLAAAAAAVVVEPSTIDDEPGLPRVRRCRTIPPTDEWQAFEQLVAPPIIRDFLTVECQTEAVHVRPVLPVTYHAGIQTEGTSTSDLAVGAQLSDRSRSGGVVIRACRAVGDGQPFVPT